MKLIEGMSDRAKETEEPGTRKASVGDITFLMVGCQRCGSTWLYEALKEHPEIYLPDAKQTHFFDESYENGLSWYLDHFDGIEPGHKAVGEVATSYCLPDAIPLVAREFPDIKIIMAMRNPVERANSFYRSRAPHEDWKNINDALNKDTEIISRGQYIDQVELLLKYYGRDQLLFLFYDDLKEDERSYLRKVYRFLGVDTDFKPGIIGNPVRAAMFPSLRRILRKMGLTPLVNLVNKSWVGDVIRRVLKDRRKNAKSTSRMPLEIRQRLHRHFHPYNERLAQCIGRDLSEWEE